MSVDQSAEVRFTPPHWLIPWITRLQVWVYEITRGWIGSRASGMPHLILRGIRRRAGKKFAVCLPYWIDDQGHRIVVASFGGAAKNPAWYHNIRDTGANPRVGIRDGTQTFFARVEVLDQERRERTWKSLVADRPFYARYQEKTEREIPLIRLLEIDSPDPHSSSTLPHRERDALDERAHPSRHE